MNSLDLILLHKYSKRFTRPDLCYDLHGVVVFGLHIINKMSKWKTTSGVNIVVSRMKKIKEKQKQI